MDEAYLKKWIEASTTPRVVNPLWNKETIPQGDDRPALPKTIDQGIISSATPPATQP
jgi:hypothetical protein